MTDFMVQQPSPQLEDDRSLIQGCQAGNLPAAARLTRRYQDEAVRVAFLLTNDNRRAVELAGAAFLDLFGGARVSEPDRAVRPWLLGLLTGRFLTQARDDAVVGGMEPPAPNPMASRFAVETDRTRTRAALMRLEEQPRAALVLYEFSRLDLPAISAILATDQEAAPKMLERARERLAANLDLDEEKSLRAALTEAAFDTPRVHLWTEIEPETEAIFRQADSRSRRINVLAGAGVIAVLLLVGALVFGDFFGGADSQTSNFAATEPSAQPAAAGTLAQALDALPTLAPTPSAGVADVLLLTRYSGNRPETVIVQSELANESMVGLPETDGEVRQAAVPLVAPDGEQVVMLYYGFEAGAVTGYVAAFDDQLRTLFWSTGIVTAPHEGAAEERPAFRLSAAVDDRRVYVAAQFLNEQRVVEIFVFERETGRQVQHMLTNLAGFAVHDVRLFSPPDDDTIYLFAITQDQPPQQGSLGMVFLGFEIPSGRQVHGKALADRVDSRVFFIYNSRYTPDGDYLYGLLYTRDRQEIAVHFFELQSGTVEPPVTIPFQPVADPMPVQHALSHDGRLLYVLSPFSKEIAIVDLEQRRLQGVVPLDMGVLAGQAVDPVYFPDAPMQLSPDGRWLYAVGASSGGDPARRSGIWLIDTVSMTVAGHWFPEAKPIELLLSGDGSSLYVRDEQSSGSEDSDGALWILNAETGFVQFHLPLNLLDSSLSSLAALYSGVFSASPAIEGAVPRDTPVTAPLAGMQVTISEREALLGDRTEITVQFVEPLTGEPVEEGTAGVRYRPPSTVRASFSTADGETDLLLDLGQAGYGRYRGVAALPAAGEWSVRVVASWSDPALDSRLSFIPNAISVDQPVGISSPGMANQFRAR